jgi:hypothetical protein
MVRNDRKVCLLPPTHLPVNTNRGNRSQYVSNGILERYQHQFTFHLRHVPEFAPITADMERGHLTHNAWRWLRMLLLDMNRSNVKCEGWRTNETLDSHLQLWYANRVYETKRKYEFSQETAEDYVCGLVQVITYHEWLPIFMPTATLFTDCFDRVEDSSVKTEFSIASRYLVEWIEQTAMDETPDNRAFLFGSTWSPNLMKQNLLQMWMERDWYSVSYTLVRWVLGHTLHHNNSIQDVFWAKLSSEVYVPAEEPFGETLRAMLKDHLRRLRCTNPKYFLWNSFLVRNGYLTEMYRTRFGGVGFEIELDSERQI